MKKYIIILSLLPLLVSGCNSFLDQVPDDRSEINDVESVKALLVSAYPDGHYLMGAELMSDNAEDKGSWGVSLYPEMQEEAYFWRVSTQNVQDAPYHYWNRLYKAISAANHALEAIEANGGGKAYDPYLGEGKMARAFNHFLLVNLWGKHYNPATAATDLGVPYVTKPEKEALVGYSRNTVKEVYDMIEKDITEGFPLLSDDAYDVPKYHFTRAAANAFMARFYLYRGEPGDWEKVVQHTTSILGAGANYKNQLRDYVGKYTPVASNWEDYSKLYTNYGDPAILLLTNAPSLWYYTSYLGRYGMTESKKDAVLTAAMVRNHRWVGGAYGSWPHYSMGKFYNYIRVAYPGAASGIPYVLCPVLTVEEAVLNRAEAYVMLKQYEKAIDDINVYLSVRTLNYVEDLHKLGRHTIDVPDPTDEDPNRTKKVWVFEYDYALNEVVAYYTARESTSIKLAPWYGNTMDNEQMCMLQYITDLRRKEYLQEGMRWFDVKRFGIEVTHKLFESTQKDVLTAGDPRREWQIPSMALEYGLEPNPR